MPLPLTRGRTQVILRHTSDMRLQSRLRKGNASRALAVGTKINPEPTWPWVGRNRWRHHLSQNVEGAQDRGLERPGSLSTATIAMENIKKALDSVIPKISKENYEQSFAFYRFWFDIGQTYHQIPPDLTFNTIFDNREGDAGCDQLIHTTARLITRFASEAESDPILAPHNAGLQSRLCTRILQEWFNDNLESVRGVETGSWAGYKGCFHAEANFIAHWANLGCVEEAVIRNHILQSLISHPKLYDHQANALIILFKLAGATFGAYADPSVVDRCFKRLNGHYSGNAVKRKLVQVRAPRCERRPSG